MHPTQTHHIATARQSAARQAAEQHRLARSAATSGAARPEHRTSVRSLVIAFAGRRRVAAV